MSIIVTGTTGGLTDLGTISLHLATMWPTPVTVIEAGACPCKTETTSVVLEALGTRKKSVSLFR